jgi:hypothetical protein
MPDEVELWIALISMHQNAKDRVSQARVLADATKRFPSYPWEAAQKGLK